MTDEKQQASESLRVLLFIAINLLLVLCFVWIALAGLATVSGSAEGLAMISALLNLPILLSGFTLVVLAFFIKFEFST